MEDYLIVVSLRKMTTNLRSGKLHVPHDEARAEEGHRSILSSFVDIFTNIYNGIPQWDLAGLGCKGANTLVLPYCCHEKKSLYILGSIFSYHVTVYFLYNVLLNFPGNHVRWQIIAAVMTLMWKQQT